MTCDLNLCMNNLESTWTTWKDLPNKVIHTFVNTVLISQYAR